MDNTGCFVLYNKDYKGYVKSLGDWSGTDTVVASITYALVFQDNQRRFWAEQEDYRIEPLPMDLVNKKRGVTSLLDLLG